MKEKKTNPKQIKRKTGKKKERKKRDSKIMDVDVKKTASSSVLMKYKMLKLLRISVWPLLSYTKVSVSSNSSSSRHICKN